MANSLYYRYMIYKKIHNLIIFYCFSFTMVIAGCAKETTTRTQTTSNSTGQTAIASDELTLSNEFDQATDDAVMVICNHKASIAGATVDTSQISAGIIEIDYYGKEQDGTKSRTGADSIHLNTVAGHVVNWGTPGAVASVTFGTVNSPGYEVLFITTNTSVRLGGTTTLTNLYGGYLQNLNAGDSLVEIIRGDLKYTFDDNAATVQYNPFNVNRVRAFSKFDTSLFANNRADTSIGNFTNVCEWGLDRFGDNYYTSITIPVKQNLSIYALSYNPLSGIKSIQNIAEPIQCTYGVNQQGGLVNSGTPYGFILTWINNGGQAQNIVAYYY